ncbi:MAG: alpha/beta hydrolase [Acidobacteria bacterium]|nr:alpha/beta hydrolase [Acidobacteriota bacterium]
MMMIGYFWLFLSGDPVCLPHTETLHLTSSTNGQEYVIYLSLPRDFSGGPYPLIVTLDADYAFPMTHAAVEHFVDRGNLPAMIVASIGYPGQSQVQRVYRTHRTRDYTPTHSMEGGYGPALQQYSGGGPKFAAFIRNELLPLLAKKYHANLQDTTFIGHSYGGLFGTYLMLKHPGIFHKYLLVSPSLWYDDRMTLQTMADAELQQTPTRVFLAVGSHEEQSNRGRGMVSDLKAFEAGLRAKNKGNFAISLVVFDDETHNSVFPGALSKGLRFLFQP